MCIFKYTYDVFVECSTTDIDLAFIVDSSSKSDSSAWPSILSFINLVIDQFHVSQNAVRAAFVRYSDNATVVFNVGQYSDASSLKAAASQVQQVRSSKNKRCRKSLKRS